MIGYRIQGQGRDITELTEVHESHTIHWDEESTRSGVSACSTLAELAAYWATGGVELEGDIPVLVKIEGPESDDTPLDADRGEVLILAETAELIEDDDFFFQIVSDLVDLDEIDFDSLVDAAEDMLDEMAS